MTTKSRILALLAAGAAAIPQAGVAQQLITNGGFESGSYAGWATNVQAGSNGGLFVVANDGGTAPASGLSYQLNPTGGLFFSTTDQNGPGSYSLTQSFTLATSRTVVISFDLFANNYGGTIAPGRDYTVDPTQNATVDLLLGGVDPFTNAATDIYEVLYGPGSDDLADNPNPWTSYSFTRTLAAGTYSIRFAEADNQGFFNQGVDNVSVLAQGGAALPEPATWAMMLAGFGLLGGVLRRRSAAVPAAA